MTSQEKYLKQLTIGGDIPGTLLKDFETFLGYIGEQEIAVTKGKKLLPMPHVKKINEALTHPYESGLKRPMHTAFPNVAALYLLFRASGIGRVVKKGAKEIIKTDPEMLEQWRSLNPTEQYFSLLEIWLIKADEGVAGESRRHHERFFFNNRQFYSKFSEDTMEIANDQGIDGFIQYLVGPVNLALMALFGMIHINAMPTETGKGRQIDTIVRTLFGSAAWPVLDRFSSDFEYAQFLYITKIDAQNSEEYKKMFQGWRSVIKSSFPEWKKTLTLPPLPFREGVHVFKLLFYKGWRRIAIPGDALLDDLAQLILNSIDFENDHLYQFKYQGREGVEHAIDHPHLHMEKSTTDEVQVGSLPIEEGEEIIFFFDFGDRWTFGLVLEKTDPEDMAIDSPVILDAHGEPPEQYGW